MAYCLNQCIIVIIIIIVVVVIIIDINIISIFIVSTVQGGFRQCIW